MADEQMADEQMAPCTGGDQLQACQAVCQKDDAALEAVIQRWGFSKAEAHQALFELVTLCDVETPSVSCCELMRTKYRIGEEQFGAMFFKKQLPDLSVTQWFITTFPQSPERLRAIYRGLKRGGRTEACAWLAAAHPECLSD